MDKEFEKEGKIEKISGSDVCKNKITRHASQLKRLSGDVGCHTSCFRSSDGTNNCLAEAPMQSMIWAGEAGQEQGQEEKVFSLSMNFKLLMCPLRNLASAV
ncbi:hypothetical protein AVEN_136673-1 [Araneus ventricosus]|uniref:Uncharacterized protein n=1 Tax=Araneus ventricosus TaxID=182803 RepID=A0A4Y2DMH2_ARAVE|nr:hypothetical protein AVEN_136673-1 [Araneus ventricosus]